MLNYHLDYYKQQKIYSIIQDYGEKNAVLVGSEDKSEYIMNPDIDLPEVSLEDAMAEEAELMAYMAAQREEKKAREKAEKAAAAEGAQKA